MLFVSLALANVAPFVSLHSTATSFGLEKPLHNPRACCCDQDVDCALVSQRETHCSNLSSINTVEWN